MPEESHAGLTEESRENDVRPYSAPFQNGQIDSSALPGISSMRGDFLFGSSFRGAGKPQA